MDRVRLGRALGYGARHAAKSLLQAVDAATAPAPAPRPAQPAARGAAKTAAPGPPAAAQRLHHAQVQTRQLKRSVWSPLAKFSSVLWLEVTGTFFALFALFMGQGLWKARAVWRASPSSHEAQGLYVHLAAFALFAYFAISSFVRAGRRQKR